MEVKITRAARLLIPVRYALMLHLLMISFFSLLPSVGHTRSAEEAFPWNRAAWGIVLNTGCASSICYGEYYAGIRRKAHHRIGGFFTTTAGELKGYAMRQVRRKTKERRREGGRACTRNG